MARSLLETVSYFGTMSTKYEMYTDKTSTSFRRTNGETKDLIALEADTFGSKITLSLIMYEVKNNRATKKVMDIPKEHLELLISELIRLNESLIYEKR